ncbi:MAG: DUF5979 domain-containing protein, partial [Clostridiales bacterium]|nr:DUF5979 domain-containing protein [Clostridiales bacterium]
GSSTTGVTVEINLTNLSRFTHPGSHTGIFTNNFWPLDNIRYSGMDPVFGSSTTNEHLKFFGYKSTTSGNGDAQDSGTFPVSDDGSDHNNYFGMTFSISFNLTDDYCGPLDYYFFGDDDMWVYLSGPNIDGEELVLDIGGVHSSIGEHVNLWNYIQNTSTSQVKTAAAGDSGSQAGTYTLTFYYTERGASGSTCYMWYTLPSVSSATQIDDTGNLRVEKQVQGTAASTADEFTFTLNMTNTGASLTDSYTYNLFNANGSISAHDQTVSSTGGTFTLKAGQYIVINNLPEGTVCTVTETNAEENGYTATYEVSTGDPDGSDSQTGNTVAGSIGDGNTTTILFTNVSNDQLPLTGGAGTWPFTVGGMLVLALAAVGFINRNRRQRRGYI